MIHVLRSAQVIRIVLLVSALGALLLVKLSAAPPAVAQAQMIPAVSLLNPDGTVNTTTGATGALDLRGWNVTLDSVHGPILSPQPQMPAKPLNAWSALPDKGLDGGVSALLVVGSDLYVGGFFSQTKDGAVTNLNNIARFSTMTHTWSALPNNGLNDGVNALAVKGMILYVGGEFTKTSDNAVKNLNSIAKFNTATSTWSALPHHGLNKFAFVNALAVVAKNLYVGGIFTSTNDGKLSLNNIAKFNTKTSTWSALPNNGLSNPVYALAVMGSDLYSCRHVHQDQ